MDELLQDEELGRILFAEFLNQHGADTGVDTERLFKKYLEDDDMEDIPVNIRQLEEKGKNKEPMVTLKELEEIELKNGESISGEELEKIKQQLNSDLSDPEKAKAIVKEVLEDLIEEYSDCPVEKEPEEMLAEPDYYAGNGLSPLEAFKKGLLSREELIGFIKGNIIKYIVRAGHKHNASEDMVKAIDYCGHLKELYEKEMGCEDSNPIVQESRRLFREALEGLDKVEDVEVRDPYAPNPKGKRG